MTTATGYEQAPARGTPLLTGRVQEQAGSMAGLFRHTNDAACTGPQDPATRVSPGAAGCAFNALGGGTERGQAAAAPGDFAPAGLLARAGPDGSVQSAAALRVW